MLAVANVDLSLLREEVCEANPELVRRGLAIEVFGNASGVDRDRGLVVIKPSGFDYACLTPGTLVVTDLSGRVVEGSLRPSSDLPTHLVSYRSFPAIGGVVHTHSFFATVWAQAGRGVPCLGTTHADYFPGPIPLTAHLTPEETRQHYEISTGEGIVRRFEHLDPAPFPAVLVQSHGAFCWGISSGRAAHPPVIPEEVARMAYFTVGLRPDVSRVAPALLGKHFFRKHEATAYYGHAPSDL